MGKRSLSLIVLLLAGLVLARGAWAIPEMNDSQGYYLDAFDSTQGIVASEQVAIDTSQQVVTLEPGKTSGWLRSGLVIPRSLQSWLVLEINTQLVSGTGLTLDLLDAGGSPLVSGLTASGGVQQFDLSGISAASLALRGNLTGTAGSTPRLNSWKVRWALKPDVFFQMQAVSDSDPQGVSVTAGNQIGYTITYIINNVDAHDVNIATDLTTTDDYGTNLIEYASGSASPVPTSVLGRQLRWMLGTLTSGTTGNITFKVNVPNGTTCSNNSATHTGGQPIRIKAKIDTEEMGSQGMFSSPQGTTLVGSAGAPNTTFVNSHPRDAIAVINPRYALPDSDYTYMFYLQHQSDRGPTPWYDGEILHNVHVTHTLPAGATYVRSGLYFNPNTSSNGPVYADYLGSTAIWDIERLGIHSSWACTAYKGVYLYITVHLPAGAENSTFTIPSATMSSDQTQGAAAKSTGLPLVTFKNEATVDANPNAYVDFAISGWNDVPPCDPVYPYRAIMSQVNKSLPTAYIVEKVPDYTSLLYYSQYCYLGGVNGNLYPAGNGTPVSYSTTVTAANLPDPPNLASGIWIPGTGAQAYGKITHTLLNLGGLHYTLLYPSHDAMYRQYYLVDNTAPEGALISATAYFYANTGTAKAQAKASNTASFRVTEKIDQSMSYYTCDRLQDPIQAGDSTRYYLLGPGLARNAYIYDILPPEMEFNPVGTTTSFYLSKNSCEGNHTCWIEYTTTPGLYPFDRQTAERAAWTRSQPLDVSKITGVRWVLGDYSYNWYQGVPFSFYVSLRAKSGTPNNTSVTNTFYPVYSGLGAAPAPAWPVKITVLSHVDMRIAKTVDKSLLPTSHVQYYLTFSNVGNMNEDSVVLWDKIPQLTEFDGTQAPAGATIYYSNLTTTGDSLPGRSDPSWRTNDYGTSTAWLRWELPALNAGEAKSVTLTVRPLAGIPVGAVISNTSYIVSSHSTTLTSNTAVVTNTPDFSDPSTTYITVDPAGEVKAGTWMKYRLRYYNTGLAAAHNVRIEDTLEARFDPATLQWISGPRYTYDTELRTLRWDIGDVGAGLGGEMEFKVRIMTGALPGGDLSNKARLKSDESPWVNSNTVVNPVLTEVQDVHVEVSPRLEGENAEYRVTFRVGDTGGLAAGEGINLEFPEQMQLPASIPADLVEVNGVKTTTDTVGAAQRLSITLPQPIDSNGTVDIKLLAGSGLKNPERGNYRLKLNTSQEMIWVDSEVYIILMGIGDNEVIVAPNPAQGEIVKFFYNMTAPGEVEIALYNVLGQQVAQIKEAKPAEKGASSVWHIGQVGSGVYLCRVTQRFADGGEKKLPVKKVIVIHK